MNLLELQTEHKEYRKYLKLASICLFHFIYHMQRSSSAEVKSNVASLYYFCCDHFARKNGHRKLGDGSGVHEIRKWVFFSWLAVLPASFYGLFAMPRFLVFSKSKLKKRILKYQLENSRKFSRVKCIYTFELKGGGLL